LFSEGKKLFESLKVLFCPSSDFDVGGDVGEESKQNDGEKGVAGMGDALFGAWIGHGIEAFGQKV